MLGTPNSNLVQPHFTKSMVRMCVAVPYLFVFTAVFVVSSDLQRDRDEESITTCRFWNITADGIQLRSIGIILVI